jgi:dihydrofolate reductase
MAKVLVNEFLTLDGVMQAPGAPDEDRSGGFDQGGWQLPYFDDAFGEFVDASFKRAGALLLGRNTYDIFAAYWPNATDDPIGDTMNGFRKYVASRTLTEPLSWQNSTLLKDNVADEVARLKESEAKDLLVFGSGDLVQTLIANSLVDEFRLAIHPIVIGKGKRLFRDEAAGGKLRLVDSKVSSTGVMLLTYVPVSAE